MAVSLMGDTGAVMATMKCSADDFTHYCDGGKEPSWPELDRLITLIVREQGKLIAENRRFITEIREKARKT